MYSGLLANLATLVLAGFVGFVIFSTASHRGRDRRVAGDGSPSEPAAWAPAVSAVSGLVVVGAVVVLGALPADAGWPARLIAVVAVVLGAMNLVGGLLSVARRAEKAAPAGDVDEPAAVQ